MKRTLTIIALASIFSLPITSTTSTASAAVSGSRTEQVTFTRNASSKTINSKITGYQCVDYKLQAKAGQNLDVSMNATNPQTYFNIQEPRSGETLFDSSTSADNQFSGVLPSTGNYTVRVFMMRDAARKNQSSNYSLDITVN